MSIAITVGMPLFRAKYIAWLALEGLIRQKDVNFEWELVVIEETNNSEVFGIEGINEYRERLKCVGCVDIQYIALDKWIPLGEKLKLMGDMSKGQVYSPVPDDYYPGPLSLKYHYDTLFNEDYDVFLPKKIIYYSIIEDFALMRDMEKSHRIDDILGRAVLTKYMKDLEPKDRSQGCDRWMYNSYAQKSQEMYGRNLRIVQDDSDNWKYGLSTFGFNNISTNEIGRWKKDKDKELWPKENMEKYIPMEVLTRLRESRENIQHHKRSWGND